ncbi:hypothetical protein ANCCAN_23737 [Ancylostoma caninum]|uniref:Uncharacterized protein n=1 Tax=Ancylostoma caninum TaxID=29170 RepID=A0A368FE82_ANCCA|nr:hypothetical protein ANCCAN_23737 [Ancylostoma caninum]
MRSTLLRVTLAIVLTSCAECGPVLATQPHFSDEFARTRVVPLCAATEGANPQTCLSRTFKNATALRKINVRCDKWAVDTCSGYVAVNHADKAIMLAFRGTLGQLQLLVESEATVFEEKVGYSLLFSSKLTLFLSQIEEKHLSDGMTGESPDRTLPFRVNLKVPH